MVWSPTLPQSPLAQQLLVLNTVFLWLQATDLDKQGLKEHAPRELLFASSGVFIHIVWEELLY
jgi:hypothetical protein